MSVDSARLKDVFSQALAWTDPADRTAYLDAACAGDAELRSRVEALLRAVAESDSLLGSVAEPAPPPNAADTGTFPHPGDDRAPSGSLPPATEKPGTVVAGRYKLLQQIGEGGMGAVWMADQTEPVKRRVAVKLIRADRAASRTILSRFEAERQAIALMNHPNIAKLLDAGTTDDGSPFFVMELVKGIPLTDYCDAHKLSVPDRLGLFRQICSAVHHAHQKGVIHRDLKPTNILMESHDGKPVPKVIDFGLAKATTGMQLTEHTLFTGFGNVMGTPLYMAPEQATFNALDVDSRADIYALGVILYELLAGSTPIHRETLKSAALDEMLRVIREQEPPPPSSRIGSSESRPAIAANRQSEPLKLGRFVRGELDWIVMKALAKERDRRYESATAFAADVERFLSHEPVSAGPPSQWYRLRKFVRRNKGRVTAASLVLFALIAGIAGTTLGLIRADRARADERAQRDIAEENERLAKAAERGATRASERAKASEAHAKTALDNADKLLGIQEWLSRGGEKRYSKDQLATLQGLASQFEAVANGGTGPDAAEAFTRLAAVQRLLNKPAEQRKSLQRSLELWIDLVRIDPAGANGSRVQVAKARRRLAGTFEFKTPMDPHFLDLLRQAAADWRAATDANPANATAWSERASVLQELVARIPAAHGYPPSMPPEAAAEQAAVRREAVECIAKAVELRPGDRALWLRLLSFQGDVSCSPAAVRLALRAATRFPDEALPRRFKIPSEWDYPYARDRETFDSDLCVRIISAGPDPASREWKANPAWLPEEAFRRVVAEPCREVLKEFPGYKYASGIEFLLKLREAGIAEWVPSPLVKPGEPWKPTQPTAEQRRRASVLYREALELARKRETKLPPEFLTFTLREKDFFEPVQRPQKSTPITAEEFVWFHRLRLGDAILLDGVQGELQRELAARKDWQPTPMFLHRILLATLPDEIIDNADVPKERLIAHWTQANALFARIRAEVSRDGEDYRIVGERFSVTAINVASRFRAMGDRARAKQAMTRCIQLIEESPERPGVKDWPFRTRCYFDRGNLHLDGGEWAAALADYQTCLKLSKQKPGEYDSLSIPGMNAVAHFRSGTALLRLGRHDEAEESFDECLRHRRAETFQSRLLKSGKKSVPWTVPTTERDRANEYLLVGRWEPAARWAARGLKTFAENEEAYAVEQMNRYRYSLHVIRATALGNLNEHAAAAKAWDVARGYATAEQLREFVALSAGAYVQVGRHEEVIRRLDEVAQAERLSADELYNLACGYSLCSAGRKVEKGAVERYRVRAVELLRKAAAAGYKDAPHMRKDTDLDPIRDRDDFKRLLADLEKNPSPETVPPRPVK